VKKILEVQNFLATRFVRLVLAGLSKRQQIYVHVVLQSFVLIPSPNFSIRWLLHTHCHSASLLGKVKSAKPGHVCCVADCLNSCAIVVCLFRPENKCYNLVFAFIYLQGIKCGHSLVLRITAHYSYRCCLLCTGSSQAIMGIMCLMRLTTYVVDFLKSVMGHIQLSKVCLFLKEPLQNSFRYPHTYPFPIMQWSWYCKKIIPKTCRLINIEI
jgi:hypothetical protein